MSNGRSSFTRAGGHIFELIIIHLPALVSFLMSDLDSVPASVLLCSIRQQLSFDASVQKPELKVAPSKALPTASVPRLSSIAEFASWRASAMLLPPVGPRRPRLNYRRLDRRPSWIDHVHISRDNSPLVIDKTQVLGLREGEALAVSSDPEMI